MKTLMLLSVLLLSGCASQPKLFDPAGLTFEADTSWQASGDFTYHDRFGRPYDGAIGRAAITMDIPLTNEFQLRYGIEHRSYLQDNGDRGEERAIAGLTWRPFRR